MPECGADRARLGLVRVLGLLKLKWGAGERDGRNIAQEDVRDEGGYLSIGLFPTRSCQTATSGMNMVIERSGRGKTNGMGVSSSSNSGIPVPGGLVNNARARRWHLPGKSLKTTENVHLALRFRDGSRDWVD
jgi:hypothetical protein